MIFKVALWGALVLLCRQMILVVLSAIKISKPESAFHGVYYCAKIDHKRQARLMFYMTIGFICLVEGVARWIQFSTGARVVHDHLFYIHLAFAISLLLLLALLVWVLDGDKFPYHRWLGYSAVGCFLPTMILGSVMIVRMQT